MTGATGQGGLTARWQGAMMNNYGTPPLALVRGSGAEVWD
ncbi:MAG: acetylornithine/N-succinyldiaminopimelate aminotransferase, partial [Pseudonocardiales bacterium]|nr:acetylornithine/N-succinyldiaminopimelate aminotransferase [Pseudonocardiales bacterium]